MRNVPFTGIEWSFLMKDLGYDDSGIKYPSDIEMETIPSFLINEEALTDTTSLG